MENGFSGYNMNPSDSLVFDFHYRPLCIALVSVQVIYLDCILVWENTGPDVLVVLLWQSNML